MHEKFLSYEVTLGSPGHEEMLWPQLVRPGDTLNGSITIKGVKISKASQIWASFDTRPYLKIRDNSVFSTTSTLIIKTRQSAS